MSAATRGRISTSREASSRPTYSKLTGTVRRATVSTVTCAGGGPACCCAASCCPQAASRAARLQATRDDTRRTASSSRARASNQYRNFGRLIEPRMQQASARRLRPAVLAQNEREQRGAEGG